MIKLTSQIKQNSHLVTSDSTYRPFQIVHPPSVVTRVCQRSKQNYLNQFSSPNFQFENILKLRRGPRIKKIGQSRETYRKIKESLADKLQHFHSNLANLQLGEVLVWKQEILAGFLTDFMVQIGKECRQKADILLFIWNSVFNIIEYLVEVVGKISRKDEKDYLNNLLDNHKDYQAVIESMKQKMARKEQSYMHQQQFIRALIYNLRYKRKEINKLSKNLKLCTLKLNEIKDCYIDLQIQHVELLADNRQISKENALNLLKRKQELNHEKRVEYKMKQSHKQIKFQIESEIENEDIHQHQNVQKLNNQLKATFNNFHKMKKKQRSMNKLHPTIYNPNEEGIQLIFENALDDFNVRIDNVPENNSIIDFKNKVAFVDASTDMEGFKLNADTVGTQITQYDKLYQGMISHRGSQTMGPKIKQIIWLEEGCQTNMIQLKNQSMSRVKVLEKSYLIEDYRDKKYKRERGERNALKYHTGSVNTFHNLKSQNKITIKSIHVQEQESTSIAVQTDPQCIFQIGNVPDQQRDIEFQKKIAQYFVKLSEIQKMTEAQIRNKVKRSTKNIPSESRKTHFGSTHSLFHEDSQSELNPFIIRQSLGNISQGRKSITRSVISTGRASASTHHTNSLYQSDALGKKGILKRRNRSPFGAIQQNLYENMLSRDVQNDHGKREASSSAEKTRKIWVMKPMSGETNNQRRQKFLNDLNKGEKMLSKKSLNRKADSLQENRRILYQLEKLSEQIDSHQLNYDSLEQNLNENMAILTEELKKMLTKKRNDRKLPISRQQSLCKIISFVYTYAYHLFFNHSKYFYSLLIPLFNYFKIGYGQIKKNDLYLRMLYFLSQVICHQEQNYIFQSFITLLGLNLNPNQKIRPGKENTALYLRTLYKLSVNFKFPLDVESLYTNIEYFQAQCLELLVEENFEPGIVQHIMNRIKSSIKHLSGKNTQDQDQEGEGDIKETKLNVYKCCQMIILEIQRIKLNLEESYSHLLNHFQIFEGNQYLTFLAYLLNNSHWPRVEREKALAIMDKEKSIIEIDGNADQKMQGLIKMMLLMKIPDFSKLYYNAIHKFKIKEEFLFLAINRRLQFVLAYMDHWSKEFLIEKKIISAISHQAEKQKSLFKQITIKKILALAYLRVVEHQTGLMHQKIIGQSLKDLYQLNCSQKQENKQKEQKAVS